MLLFRLEDVEIEQFKILMGLVVKNTEHYGYTTEVFIQFGQIWHALEEFVNLWTTIDSWLIWKEF